MASLQDVADQINGKLDAINGNTSATAANTEATANNTAATAATAADLLDVTNDLRDLSTETNSRLAGIENELNEGFTNLSQGLFATIELQRATNRLLDHHRKQNDTIICELVNGNDLLCTISRKLTRQIKLDEATLTATLRLEGIAERVHADASSDYDRDLEVRRKIDECCPPPVCEEEPCPEPCEEPKFKDRKPDGQDWEPLPDLPRPVG